MDVQQIEFPLFYIIHGSNTIDSHSLQEKTYYVAKDGYMVSKLVCKLYPFQSREDQHVTICFRPAKTL